MTDSLCAIPHAGRPGLLSALAAFALASCGGAALAGALDGTLEVRSAYVDVDKGVFQLHAHIEYPVNAQIEKALEDGITLTFDLDVNVARERRLWFDADVANLQLQRELAYHTVSERFVVRDTKSGEQHSFPSLATALDYLGTVDGWPIVVEPQLNGASDYRVSVRAGIRRGHLPDTLRVLLFWTNDWRRTSGWYSWSLPR
ncbi:MAG TPA: DUF4390 domain-containing protein [Steroidobacteraceae bacterium]